MKNRPKPAHCIGINLAANLHISVERRQFGIEENWLGHQYHAANQSKLIETYSFSWLMVTQLSPLTINCPFESNSTTENTGISQIDDCLFTSPSPQKHAVGASTKEARYYQSGIAKAAHSRRLGVVPKIVWIIYVVGTCFTTVVWLLSQQSFCSTKRTVQISPIDGLYNLIQGNSAGVKKIAPSLRSTGAVLLQGANSCGRQGYALLRTAACRKQNQRLIPQ